MKPLYGRPVLFAILLIATSALAGCLDGATPVSFIQSPRVLLDYDNETGLFQTYIHGLEDSKYDNITLTVRDAASNESLMLTKTDTYALIETFAMTNFTFDISVVLDEVLYVYNATITVADTADGFELTIITVDGDDETVRTVEDDELPYVRYLERYRE